MITSYIPHLLKDLCRARRPRRAGRRGPVFRPSLEALEERAQPSTVTWDGGSPTNGNWSDARNWVGDIAPGAGADLVFPAGAARTTNTNNFASGTVFDSLSFSGTSYNIGSSSVLNLGAGGISSTGSSTFNIYNGPIQLDASRTISVASGTLDLGGALSGAGGIIKTGPGALALVGTDANSYKDFTDVRDGRLELNKGSSTVGGRIAIPGNLQIVSSSISNSEVRFFHDNQIADNVTVTLTVAGKDHRPVLNLNGSSDTFGALNVTGGLVDTRKISDSTVRGVLTLNGDVTGQAALIAVHSGIDTFHAAEIDGSLALGVTRTITVNPLSGAELGLEIFADTTGGTLIKEGAGQLAIVGATLNGVQVNAGTLNVPGILTGNVIIRNDALLTGLGEVRGAVTSAGGAVQTLDDGSAGFSTSSGWGAISGQGGFGNDVTTTSQDIFGTLKTATWAFTGLTPGVYRVFATWTSGLDRTSNALYNIFDNTVARSSSKVDQERAPVNGPKDGGVVFQLLGSPVNITSGTLKVELTTKFAGGVFVADAIRIERMAGILSPDLVLTQDSGNVTLGAGSTYGVNVFSDGALSAAEVLEMAGTFTASGALLAIASDLFTAPSPGTAFRIITPGSFTGAFSNLPLSGDPIELVFGGQRHTFTINYLGGGVDLVYQNTATQVRDLTLSPDVINEGQRVTLRGALTDPNRGDVLSLRIAWGDGVVQTFTDLGTNPFHFTHTYADNSPAGSPYLVRVEWFDQHGAGNFQKLFVTVNNVPPRLFLGGAEVVRTGEVMQHTAHFTDPGADTYTATVDYGDGSVPQPVVIQPGQQLLLAHRYAKPGKYRVTVTVLDDDGGLVTDTFQAIVLPPQ